MAQSVVDRLWARALAIDDRKGFRIVLVTTDLIGLPRSVSDVVGARVEKEYGLSRSQLLMNSSHTHAGPIVWTSGRPAFELRDEQTKRLMEYRSVLVERLVAVVGAALKNLTSVEISYGTGHTTFAVNRDGLVDHRVPVLRVARMDGSILSIVFGYACLNTSLDADNRAISGDYAGHAQVELERKFPTASAMFLMLGGADQNPSSRGRAEYVHRHGSALADEVARVARRKLDRISGPISAAFSFKDLALAEPLSRPLPYPIQAIRFGRGLVLVALGGAVAVDYALRIEKQFPKTRMVVAGYSNDATAYAPTAAAEDRIMTGVQDALRRVGIK